MIKKQTHTKYPYFALLRTNYTKHSKKRTLMSEQNQSYLAKGLDDPIPIFFFDPVDFILITTFFGIGVVMREMIVGFFLAWPRTFRGQKP